jgi:hypothetical protein
MAERPARRRKPSKSVEQLKTEINARETAAAERREKRKASKKSLSPAEKYEQEKAARAKKGSSGYGYSQHLMGGSGSSSSFNPRSVREEVLSYLLDEGFASDEKSAEAIMTAMSEEWKHSIVEGDALRNTIKTLEGKRDAMNVEKPGSANTAALGKQSVGAATYKAYQRLRGV